MRKQSSAISHQSSEKKQPRSWLQSIDCRLSTAYSSQRGIALPVIIIVMALVLIGAIVIGTPQIRQGLFSQHVNPTSTPFPSSTPLLSAKQQLYLRNKDSIKAHLNLTDEQFDLLVQNADKN